MSFYADFLAEIDRTAGEAADQAVDPAVPMRLDARQTLFDEAQVFLALATLMRRSTIVRLSGEQSQVFLDTPEVPDQDYVTWLRLPFPDLYIALDRPMVMTHYRGEYSSTAPGAVPEHLTIRGLVLREITRDEAINTYLGRDIETLNDIREKLAEGRYVRAIQVVALAPLPTCPLNIHGATTLVLADNTLWFPRRGLWEARQRLARWMVHLVNFLASPSIKLLRVDPPAALQKARARRGKPPLPSWHEIVYRRTVADYTKGKIATGFGPRVRFDVRGHFKRFTRGRMTGRVVWCPPHQRGLANALYRPKGYRVDDPPPAAEAV